MRIVLIAVAAFAIGPAAANDAPPVEAVSFAGDPLRRPFLEGDALARQETLLGEAEAALAANPGDPDALIWKGRRLGYLGRYGEAIDVFAAGAAKFPGDARFLRHLGHRLFTVRKIDEAIAALSGAAALAAARPDEVEPDGLPNEAGIPTSTLKGNIYYHLALAHYLKGDFDGAARFWQGSAALDANPDSAAASRYWLYLALARAGETEAARAALAPVSADWKIIENGAYHRLALCFKGEGDCGALLAEARSEAGLNSTTIAYGLAAKRLIDGDGRGARLLMQEITAAPDWASFGHIAAEADLAFRRTEMK